MYQKASEVFSDMCAHNCKTIKSLISIYMQIKVNLFTLADFTDAVEKAPFDIDKNHMKIPTNEERIKVQCRSHA